MHASGNSVPVDCQANWSACASPSLSVILEHRTVEWYPKGYFVILKPARPKRNPSTQVKINILSIAFAVFFYFAAFSTKAKFRQIANTVCLAEKPIHYLGMDIGLDLLAPGSVVFFVSHYLFLVFMDFLVSKAGTYLRNTGLQIVNFQMSLVCC